MKSKNKKGKVVSLNAQRLSPEKYIKTQARNLPIFECFVSDDWEDAGICNISIARKHITGNVTVGMYLVDLYCLGLKDTHYEFNISPDDYEYLNDGNFGLIKCDYTLVHNIIHGAIAFANDYGFEPHKDFVVTQFILEEDDEQVELVDLEFGFDGKPCFIPGPDDDEAKIKKIRAKLERTAGPGNFEIWDTDDDIEDYDEDDIFDGEFEDDFIDGLQEDLQKSYQEFGKILKKVNKVYDALVRLPEAKVILANATIGKNYKVSKGIVKNEYTNFDNSEQEEDFQQLKQLIVESNDYEKIITSIKEAIKKYPYKPMFYDLLIPVYHFDRQYDKQKEVILQMYQLFPEILMPKVGYATLLLEEGNASEALNLFKGKSDLNHLYPKRKMFYITEAADYYACMCRIFIALDDIDSADLYMNAIFKKKLTEVPGNTLVNRAMMELCSAKMKKIEEINADN